jgi:hypothetical protein
MIRLAALATSFISDDITNAGLVEMTLLGVLKKEAGDPKISRR